MASEVAAVGSRVSRSSLRCAGPCLGFALLAVHVGCATVMYPGPRRSAEEVAVFRPGKNTEVRLLDGQPVGGGSAARYEILPGRHEVSATAEVNDGYGPVRSGRFTVCFEARPRHVYKLRSTLERNFANEPLWKTVVVDNRTDEIAQLACGRTERPPVLDHPPGPEADPPAATASGTAAQGRPDEHRPGTGIQLGGGLAYGGDKAATITFTNGSTSNLRAGSGLDLWLGGSFTPLWLDGIYGFGVGGSLGFKYNSIGVRTLDISASRVPFELWLQALMRVSQRTYVVMAGGLHKEMRVTFSLSGAGEDDGSVSLRSPLGYMGALGLYFASSWHTGYGIGLRVTRVRYEADAGSLDATNVGLGASFHFNP